MKHTLLEKNGGWLGALGVLLLLLLAPGGAMAGVATSNAVLLDPFDPVPEIQFQHYGGYGCVRGCGGDECDRGCYRHRYRHCDEDCCRHDCEHHCRERCIPHCDDGYPPDGDHHDGDGDHHDGPPPDDHHDGDHHDGDHHDAPPPGDQHDGPSPGDHHDAPPPDDHHDGPPPGDHHDGDGGHRDRGGHHHCRNGGEWLLLHDYYNNSDAFRRDDRRFNDDADKAKEQREWYEACVVHGHCDHDHPQPH